MILFNFKSWSALKTLLGISVVFNIVLLVLGVYAISLFGNEARQREKLDYVFDQTLIMETCLRGLPVYEMKTATGSANYVPLEEMASCYNSWNSIFKK